MGNSWLYMNEFLERVVDICYDHVMGKGWNTRLSGVEVTLRSHCLKVSNQVRIVEDFTAPSKGVGNFPRCDLSRRRLLSATEKWFGESPKQNPTATTSPHLHARRREGTSHHGTGHLCEWSAEGVDCSNAHLSPVLASAQGEGYVELKTMAGASKDNTLKYKVLLNDPKAKIWALASNNYNTMLIESDGVTAQFDAPEEAAGFNPQQPGPNGFPDKTFIVEAVDLLTSTKKLTHFFYGHGHYDHVGGAGLLKKAFPDMEVWGTSTR